MNEINFKTVLRIIIASWIFVAICACQSIAEKPLQSDAHQATTAPKNEPAPEPEKTSTEPVAPKIYTDVWGRIRDGYGLPEANNERIEKELNWFSNYRNYYSNETAQSRPYIHYVVTELQRNQIPLEIALLPFIESAYNPHAQSPGRQSNVGMWQIAPITGKYFGLHKNNWYDGRKDVIASTDVAIQLLKKMYAMFDNDWLLAIAAYNAGEGVVYGAIQKNKKAGKPTDFWSLPLPKTTLAYVSKIYALSRIVKNPEAFQYELASIPDEPYFITLVVGPQINLSQLAEQTSLETKHFKNINAGFNSWMTDPTSQRSLLVPFNKASEVQAALDALPPIPLLKWIEHKVKAGDTLYDLARHYGVSLQAITNNNGIKNNLLHLGQVLQIPLNAN